MHKTTYSTEPVPGSRQYKLSALLQHHLSSLIEHSPEQIENILQKVDTYSSQLSQIKLQNINPAGAGHKALEDLHEMIPAENKKSISCTKGCTGCCFIELHITVDEADLLLQYCEEHHISIDRNYLEKQAATGRKEFSAISKCIFLDNSLCSVYPARPAACRKHFVQSDPSLCDSETNKDEPVNTYFDLHTEILASAILNISETDAIERVLLKQLDNRSRR
jgi:Fe-S-cluster containining protein